MGRNSKLHLQMTDFKSNLSTYPLFGRKRRQAFEEYPNRPPKRWGRCKKVFMNGNPRKKWSFLVNLVLLLLRQIFGCCNLKFSNCNFLIFRLFHYIKLFCPYIFNLALSIPISGKTISKVATESSEFCFWLKDKRIFHKLRLLLWWDTAHNHTQCQFKLSEVCSKHLF